MPQASPSALPPARSSVMMWVTYEMTKHNGHSARRCATCEPAQEAHLPGHQSVPAPTNSRYPPPTPQPSSPPLYPSKPSLLAEPLHGFVSLTTPLRRHKRGALPSFCIIVQMSSTELNPGGGQFMNFARNAINNLQPLCGRPYSQVCIYSSLWPQPKFPKWPFQGLGLKKNTQKKTVSSVSRIPLVSFRWL